MDPCRRCGTAGIAACPDCKGEGKTRKPQGIDTWGGRLSGYSVTTRIVTLQGR